MENYIEKGFIIAHLRALNYMLNNEDTKDTSVCIPIVKRNTDTIFLVLTKHKIITHNADMSVYAEFKILPSNGTIEELVVNRPLIELEERKQWFSPIVTRFDVNRKGEVIGVRFFLGLEECDVPIYFKPIVNLRIASIQRYLVELIKIECSCRGVRTPIDNDSYNTPTVPSSREFSRELLDFALTDHIVFIYKSPDVRIALLSHWIERGYYGMLMFKDKVFLARLKIFKGSTTENCSLYAYDIIKYGGEIFKMDDANNPFITQQPSYTLNALTIRPVGFQIVSYDDSTYGYDDYIKLSNDVNLKVDLRTNKDIPNFNFKPSPIPVQPPCSSLMKKEREKGIEMENKVNALLGKVSRMSKQIDHIEAMLCNLVNNTDPDVIKGKVPRQTPTNKSSTKKKKQSHDKQINLFDIADIDEYL